MIPSPLGGTHLSVVLVSLLAIANPVVAQPVIESSPDAKWSSDPVSGTDSWPNEKWLTPPRSTPERRPITEEIERILGTNRTRFPIFVIGIILLALSKKVDEFLNRRIADETQSGPGEDSVVNSSSPGLPAREPPPARRFVRTPAIAEYTAYVPQPEALAHSGFHPPAVADFDMMWWSQEAPPGFARFQGGPNGLWLHFNQAAQMRYLVTADFGYPSRCTDGPTYSMAKSFAAGQKVRVIDAFADADGLGHEPTVRALSTQVYVSPVGAATEIRDPQDTVHFSPTTDDLAFCRAMCAAPDDELPRLIYADWLQERGHPLARFMRSESPFWLYEWVAVGQGWQGRSNGRASWGQAIRAVQDFCSQGEVADLPATGGPNGLARFFLNPLRPDGRELRRLSVTLDTGNSAPQFVTDLFQEIARLETNETPASPLAESESIA